MKLDFDCIIIGAGVAGMTSALYLKRSGINAAIFEKNFVGGQINKTNSIKNYPGYKEIDGPTLALSILSQIEELEIPIIYEEVYSIIDNEDFKVVKTNNKEYNTKTIIIASGRKERTLGLDHENDFIGRGISWCATCDGNFFKDKDVIVIGGGNTAMEEALYLSNICNKVYIINRSNNLRADKILIEQVKQKENVSVLLDSVAKTLMIENDVLKGLELQNNEKISASGIFIAIGSDPEVEFIKDLKLEMKNNYILVKENMATSIKGIYACGDVTVKDLYQIVTAVSDGAIAANSVKNYLNR